MIRAAPFAVNAPGTIVEAVDRQLGLKLERRPGKGQVLVIDAIDEEPREN